MSAAARMERASVRAAAPLFSPEFLAAATQDVVAELERSDVSAMQLIQRQGWPEDVDGERWLDTRPMLDAREVGQHRADMARIALDHTLERKLVERHPVRAHLVRARRRA